ncbi:hypothetical protein PR202_gb05287 [Eleusine coracana subsp. coracana]|uniref:GBF-interacting protein 1 N-terminal domain-containing protein n=1 Tax=Eleusine coracana subsp. coracana TaxID=191504 RepID=A0AAV5E686_ELECO|nr:hypothetical protein PR202_gb05287 [Eleusine coracana subsp. coracana]
MTVKRCRSVTFELSIGIKQRLHRYDYILLLCLQTDSSLFRFLAVDVPSVDAESASAKFQHLSIQNEDIGATKSAEENPAVILPDHLQVANADCAHLSFGSFGSGAFSGLLSSNAPQSSLEEEVPIPDESPSVNQVDVRNQDYYEKTAIDSSANEDVETRISANLENIDVPSVSEPDVLRQGALDVPGLQYDLPSVSSHAYSNTMQPSTVDDPQGNTQAPHLSPFSSLLNYYLTSAAFQQAYSSNGPFHQSAAPAVPGAGTQFKDPNHYATLQQNDSSAMWLHGAAGSRAVSAVPPSNFYGFQGQSQQGGFRQAQQPSQYGGIGYPSFYQSQAGLPQEHPQNPAEGSLNNPQAAPSQPSHQLWQHSY